MIYENNPEFVQEFYSERHKMAFYGPAQATDYHMSRYVAAQAQDLYSSVGATKETLHEILKHVLSLTDSDKPVASFRSEIAVAMQNLLYRMKYPVDEDCGLRMGAIFTFIEGEDPKKTQEFWTQKKVSLAKEDADLYAFFLSKGISATPSYAALLSTLTDTDLRKRAEVLQSLTPQGLSPI